MQPAALLFRALTKLNFLRGADSAHAAFKPFVGAGTSSNAHVRHVTGKIQLLSNCDRKE